MAVHLKSTLLWLCTSLLLSLINGENCGTDAPPNGDYRINKYYLKYVFNSSYMSRSDRTDSSAREILAKNAAIGKPLKTAFPTIEGAVCTNYENITGAMAGQFQCPIDGFEGTDVSCCGAPGVQYCCSSCSPPKNDITGTAIVITMIVITVVVVIAFIYWMRKKLKKETKGSIRDLEAKIKEFEKRTKKEILEMKKKEAQKMNPFVSKAAQKKQRKKQKPIQAKPIEQQNTQKPKKNKQEKKTQKNTVIPMQPPLMPAPVQVPAQAPTQAPTQTPAKADRLRIQSIPETDEHAAVEEKVPDVAKESRDENKWLDDIFEELPGTFI